MFTRRPLHLIVVIPVLCLYLGCASGRSQPSQKTVSGESRPDSTKATEQRLLDLVNTAHRVEELESLGVDKVAARKLIEQRGPSGYGSTKDFGVRISSSNVELALGDSTFGSWELLPYTMQRPNGSVFPIVHAALLHTGKIILLKLSGGTETLLWDPTDEVNPQFSTPSPQAQDWLFCSGNVFLPDGKLLAMGGGGGSPEGGNTHNHAWLFDPLTEGWTKTGGDMTHSRWYPTPVLLGDGRVFLTAGLGGGTGTDEPEIYNPLTETFTPTGNTAKRPFPESYPGLHLLPNGDIFYSRTGWGHGRLEPTGPAAVFHFTNPSTGQWSDIGTTMNSPDRTEGMSVLLLKSSSPEVRVMVIGGGDPSQAGRQTAEIFDLSATPPTWSPPTSLLPGRFNVNAVLLPDGNVFVFGGRDSQNQPSAMFNTATDTWAPMANQIYRREYHSVGVLLPNGKVMTTGGDYGQGPSEKATIELFSPPYLFGGPRPQIDQVPGSITYNQGFNLNTPTANIEKVVLVRPMAVTHHTDAGQRVVELGFTRVGDTLTVTAPGGAQGRNLAPPGYYMVFILNSAGVPSEAEFVRLTGGPEPEANLSVSLSDSPDPVMVNQNLIYTIDVTNHGPNDATNVILTHPLPAGSTFVETNMPGMCSMTGGTVTCTLGSLASGNSFPAIEITVMSVQAGVLNNVVEVSGAVSETDPLNNTAQESTNVVTPGQFSIFSSGFESGSTADWSNTQP